MDLRTTYMGLELKNPLVASASPVSESLDGIRRLEEAGAAAVVMFSLFEEQLQHEQERLAESLTAGSESFAEALHYFPDPGDFAVGPEQYLDLLHRATEKTDIPIIASLNGTTNRGWTEYARQMQAAGARGIELNVYHIPADVTTDGREVEQRYLDVLQAVKSAVTVPVALKMNPFFSALGNMALRLDQAGADALVLFNRFYQPDFDLDRLEVVANLNLSTAAEIRLPLLWIALLHGRVNCSLGASRGVHSAREVVKYLLAGADAVMTTSALLQNGIGFLESLIEDLAQWMERHEYESVAQMKGAMSQRSVADPTAFERANYIKILEKSKRSYTLGA